MSRELPQHRGKVLGYRAWRLTGHELRSTWISAPWKPGPNRAVCRTVEFADRRCLRLCHAGPEPHDAPAWDCLCGLYAYHSLEPAKRHGFLARLAPSPGVAKRAPVVIGGVLAWGRLEVHASGFRAEHAEPIILAWTKKESPEGIRRVQALGSEMGLRVVDIDALETLAREFGEPVPKELRPWRRPYPRRAKPPAGYRSPPLTLRAKAWAYLLALLAIPIGLVGACLTLALEWL